MLNAGTNSEKYCLNHETAQGTQTHENTHTVNGAERPISGWQGTVQGGDGGRESGREALGGGRTEMVFCAVGGKLQDLTFLAFFLATTKRLWMKKSQVTLGSAAPHEI